MDSVGLLEVKCIIDDKIVKGRCYFRIVIAQPPAKLWIPGEKIPSSELVIEYCKQSIQNISAKKRKPDEIALRIYNLLSQCEKKEFDRLVSNFLTAKGLQLPISQYESVLERLKQIVHEGTTDNQTMEKLRRDILIERILQERNQQLVNLKKAELEINVISDSNSYIGVVNNIDLEPFPANFRYTNKYIACSPAIPEEVMVGCDCSTKETCCLSACSHFNDEKMFRKTASAKAREKGDDERVLPYDENGRISNTLKCPIYECNKFCKCDDSCQRRVVQKGSKIPLEIFRCLNRTGWGVRTLEFIPKGQFICRYSGEVIEWEAGNLRSCKEYLFDIDYNIDPEKGHSTFTVDAFQYGNVSRFINHSCNSNLSIHVVFINNVHPELGEICFFSHRDIEAMEELTINYEGLVKKNNNNVCRCAQCA
ncbi:histone-lysine N-methyltransferase SUV39H2-like [Planococcus citri]|uniref:histone-lysine N-methyltransferase SUV39H2-like n=1 Tax=Planococcus citri TaxID=170843 RepID=UPI0031FA45AE